MRASRLLSSFASVMAPGLAVACGGRFCDRSRPTPPVQASERIIFVQEPGQMTALVQIVYQGAADDFAWVVPVPAIPELDTAEPALFDDLDQATAPPFTFKYAERTETVVDGGGIGCASSSGSNESFAAEETESERTTAEVRVIGREAVGPYDTVILDSSDAGAMVEWLQGNGYAVADRAAQVLRDYVERDHYFVALKLRTQLGVDALRPLAIRYAGSEPCIPLRITAFASVPQLAVTAFIISSGRAFPLNYDHVRPDYQAVRPLGGGFTSYGAEVDLALTDHPRAFVTELAGPTDALIVDRGATRSLLQRGAYITRLFTRIRPVDMTMDPMFELRPGAPPVTNEHLVDLRDDPFYARVTRRVVDRSIAGPLALPLMLLVTIFGLRRRRGSV